MRFTSIYLCAESLLVPGKDPKNTINLRQTSCSRTKQSYTRLAQYFMAVTASTSPNGILDLYPTFFLDIGPVNASHIQRIRIGLTGLCILDDKTQISLTKALSPV